MCGACAEHCSWSGSVVRDPKLDVIRIKGGLGQRCVGTGVALILHLKRTRMIHGLSAACGSVGRERRVCRAGAGMSCCESMVCPSSIVFAGATPCAVCPSLQDIGSVPRLRLALSLRGLPRGSLGGPCVMSCADPLSSAALLLVATPWVALTTQLSPTPQACLMTCCTSTART